MSHRIRRIEITHNRDELWKFFVAAGYVAEAIQLQETMGLTVLYDPSDEELLLLTDLLETLDIKYYVYAD